MYTIQELRDCIKAELDRQAYMEEPYSLFEPIKYSTTTPFSMTM